MAIFPAKRRSKSLISIFTNFMKHIFLDFFLKIFSRAFIKFTFTLKKTQPLKWCWFDLAAKNVTPTTPENNFITWHRASSIVLAKRFINRRAYRWRKFFDFFLFFYFWTTLPNTWDALRPPNFLLFLSLGESDQQTAPFRRVHVHWIQKNHKTKNLKHLGIE